jgi:hypothetical protein
MKALLETALPALRRFDLYADILPVHNANDVWTPNRAEAI